MLQKASKRGSKDLSSKFWGGARGVQCYQNSYIIMNEQPRLTIRARIRRVRRAKLLVNRKYYSWSVMSTISSYLHITPCVPTLPAWIPFCEWYLECGKTYERTKNTWRNSGTKSCNQRTSGDLWCDCVWESILMDCFIKQASSLPVSH